MTPQFAVMSGRVVTVEKPSFSCDGHRFVLAAQPNGLNRASGPGLLRTELRAT